MSEKSNTRIDEARTYLLGQHKQFSVELFSVGDRAYEIRQPSIKQRSDALRSATTSEGTIDLPCFKVYLLIECLHEKESGERVFTQHDFDVLTGYPTNSWVDNAGSRALAISNSSFVEADAEKNSEATPDDN